MKIILEVDGTYSKKEVIAYMMSINIDDEFIKSIKFEGDFS